MAQPQQPLEIFLIRSYFNKNHKARPPVPTCWGGCQSLSVRTYAEPVLSVRPDASLAESGVEPQQTSAAAKQQQTAAANTLRGLHTHRPTQTPDMRTNTQLWVMQRLVRQTVETDWHLIITLRYDCDAAEDANRPHRYTLEACEDGLSLGAVTLACKKPWDFLPAPLSLLKHLDHRLTDGEKMKILNGTTGPFTWKFSKSFVYIEDQIGSMVGMLEGLWLPLTAPEAIELSCASFMKKNPQSRLYNFLAMCPPMRSWVIQKLPLVREILLRIARQQKADPLTKQTLIQQLKQEFLGFFSWCYENVLSRLDGYKDPRNPASDAVISYMEYIRRLSDFCSSAETSEEAIVSAFSEPTAAKWQEASTEIMKIHSNNLQLEEHLEMWETILNEKLEFAKGHTSAQKSEYQTKGLFWRECQLPRDITDILLLPFIRAVVPKFIVYDTARLRPVWGGNQMPSAIFGYKSFTVVLTQSTLATVHNTAPRDVTLDESRWNTIDIKELEGYTRVVKRGHEYVDKGDGCVCASSRCIVVVDLRSLDRGRLPRYSVMLGVADVPMLRRSTERTNVGFQYLSRSKSHVAGILGETDLFVAEIGGRHKKERKVWLTALDVVHDRWLDSQPAVVEMSSVKQTVSFLVHGCRLLVNNRQTVLIEGSVTREPRCNRTFFLAAVNISLGDGLDEDGVRKIEIGETSYCDLNSKSSNDIRTIDYRGRDLVFFKDQKEVNCLAVVHNGKIAKLSSIQDPKSNFSKNVWATTIYMAQVDFDPKTLTFRQISARGRYGEGYTISVHPLKLLLN